MTEDMNQVEQRIAEDNPALTRILTSQRPRELGVLFEKRMNPDFRLFEPPYAGIWVEVKGHLRDRMWFRGLAALPPWVKDVYKVVLVSRSLKERDSYRQALEKAGIECADSHVPLEWYTHAMGLYTKNKDKRFDCSRIEHAGKAKIVVRWDSEYWEV